MKNAELINRMRGEILETTYAAFDKDITLPQPFYYETRMILACDVSPIPDAYAPFWYHPDHLGSSSYITNLSGEINQHMEYLPFGELLVEEHLNSYNSPFKFNAKEFDAETGNYYYGARYYDPKWVIWLSVDAEFARFPSYSPYNYTLLNPINLVDPDGNAPINIHLRFQNPSAKQAYISRVNKSLGATSQISINESRYVTLTKTGVQGPLTREQQAFYSEYKAIVDSPITVRQTIVMDDKNTEVGSFFTGRVDMSDIEAFDKAGIGGTSSAGALIHETVEQHEKSKFGLLPNEWSNIVGLDELSPEYISSHEKANEVENRVNGNIKNEDNGYFLEKDGSKTHQVITPNEGSINVEKNRTE